MPSWIYEFPTVKSFMDSVRKNVLDIKGHADNVPVTGVKGEATGGSVTATGGSLSVFGVQTEYNLVKHEATAIDLNKILEGNAQERIDKEQDRRLHDLGIEAVGTKNLVEQVKRELATATADIRRTQSEGDHQVDTRVTALRDKIDRIRLKLLEDDQVLHRRITALSTRVGEVSSVAHAADGRSKSTKIKAADLERKVRDGLRQVEGLQGSARGASRDIGILIDRVTALERSLR
ncbi:hypothetical protein AB0M32_48485 [Streptomyces sp. NPDC051985]|uniref:hypothetical protein n=1 Tax=Streptomyces sp. NPDC051985 TaxID=3155807 RepID=UPI0034224821